MAECGRKLWPVFQNRELTDRKEIEQLMGFKDFTPKVCGYSLQDGAVRCPQCGRKTT